MAGTAQADRRYLTVNEFARECRQTIKLIVCAGIFDSNVLTFYITSLA